MRTNRANRAEPLAEPSRETRSRAAGVWPLRAAGGPLEPRTATETAVGPSRAAFEPLASTSTDFRFSGETVPLTAYMGVHGMLTDTLRHIVARWDTVCHNCHCAIKAGQRVLLGERASGARIRTRTTLEDREGLEWNNPALVRKGRQTPKGRPVYHVDSECGNLYRVKVTYIATSKWYVIPAFTSDAALATARLKADRVYALECKLREALTDAAPDEVIAAIEASIHNARERQVRPSSYVVYQGNVAVRAA